MKTQKVKTSKSKQLVFDFPHAKEHPRFIQKNPEKNWHIAQIFKNVDMRMGHDALTQAAKGNVTWDKIKSGSGNIIVFINRDKNRIKLFFTKETMIYHKQRDAIDERTIYQLAETVNASGRVMWDKANEKFLLEALAKRGRLVEPEDLKLKPHIN